MHAIRSLHVLSSFHPVHALHVALSWSGPGGIPALFIDQLKLVAVVVLAGSLIAGGTGIVLGHLGKGGRLAVNAANAFRAVPSLALLTLLATYSAIAIPWNGLLAPFIALTVLAIPPILTNTYVGIREVDRDVVEAAKAMGLTGFQVMTRVELPLGLPFIVAGIRIAAVEVVATSTLAAYAGYQDLGSPVLAGLNTGDIHEALYGSLVVGAMAAMVAILLGVVLRLITPAHQRAGRRLGGLVPAPTGTVALRT